MGEKGDEEIQNLPTVGALEILTDSEQVKGVARNNQTGEALKNFNLIGKFWYGD